MRTAMATESEMHVAKWLHPKLLGTICNHSIPANASARPRCTPLYQCQHKALPGKVALFRNCLINYPMRCSMCNLDLLQCTFTPNPKSNTHPNPLQYTIEWCRHFERTFVLQQSMPGTSICFVPDKLHGILCIIILQPQVWLHS